MSKTPDPLLRGASAPVGLLLTALLCSCGVPDCPPAPRQPVPADPPSTDEPNILVFLADDVGVDAVDTWKTWPGAVATPALDGLAAHGALFTRAWSNPVCSPSRASLLTGRHSRRTGIGRVLHPLNSTGGLALDEVTVAELLREAPVPRATALVGKWHLSTTDVGGLDHPRLQGFQHVRATLGNLTDETSVDGRPQSYVDYEKNTDGTLARTQCHATEALRVDALELIDQLPEPWFLLASFHAAHIPLHDPPEQILPYDGPPPTTPQGRYRRMVGSIDATIGRIVDGLHPDVRARTWIIFAGDNGPDSGVSPRPIDNAHDKVTVYEAGVHVPLLISLPGLPPSRIDTPVHLVDLFPTLAAIAGVDPSALGAIDGVNLLPWVMGDVPDNRVVYTEIWDDQMDRRAVRDIRYKLVSRDGHPPELYDMDGRDVEGPDLLLAPLDAESDAARAALAAHLDQASLDPDP